MMKTLTKIPDIFEKIILKLLGNEGIYYINGTSVLPPPLEKEEENQLLIQLKTGSKDAKNRLIERNLRLVVYIANTLFFHQKKHLLFPRILHILELLLVEYSFHVKDYL